MSKSTTDLHWQNRAQTVKTDRDVNIQDVYQRDLEYEFICPFLKTDMEVAEVGCGNGYSTSVFRPLVRHIDSFDQSESMIARAKETYGEKNNRFFVDNVLAPQELAEEYDAVICVRVLINLRNLEEQKTAVNVLKKIVKPGGLFILVEGYQDGFRNLNVLRHQLSLPDLEPAKINYYSQLNQILPLITNEFRTVHEYHLGSYDYLTRVVYPRLVGQENVTHNTQTHEIFSQTAKVYNPAAMKDLSRIRGYVFQKSTT